MDIHLYFVFFEVLKNALFTSVRKAQKSGVAPPPIHASLMTGTSMDHENERTVKITDAGEGIRRDQVRKVWSYFYSTAVDSRKVSERDRDVEASPTHKFDISDESRRWTVAQRGLGLPMSRVLTRYFGGKIDLHSIPRKGTDVYIYL